jgi:hypothetical protein
MHPKDQLSKRPVCKGFLMSCLMVAGLWMGTLSNAAAEPTPGLVEFMQASGQWLLDRQRPDGSFPNSVGDPDVVSFANVQAPSGLGMLSSWYATENQAFLDSAVAAGDYLLANFELFPDNSPRIRSFDPLFFVRLSEASGDPQYATFIQDNFWTPLANGTYGPDGDWDMADYAASELARRAGVGSALAGWDLAMIAVAAEEAGITTFRAALGAGARAALEAAPDPAYVLGTQGYDILGLAGAVWIGAITGESVTPASGPWAGLPLSGLTDALIAHQAGQGGFLQSSQAFSSPIDVAETVSQTTAFALFALDAINPTTYFDEISRGLNVLINTFQTETGRINYFHPEADLGIIDSKPFVYLHAFIMLSVEDTRDPEPPLAVPVFSAWSLTLLLLMMLSLGWVALGTRK